MKSAYHSDGLLHARGLAALAVVGAHYELGPYVERVTSLPLGFVAISGNYSVFFFFALSGYLMAKILTETYSDNIGQYYFNRLARIAPTYYLAVILPVIVTGFVFVPADHWHVLIFNAEHANVWVKGYAGNGILWSLSVEMKFYALAPLLFLLSQRLRHLPMALFILGAFFKYWHYQRFGSIELPYRHQYFALDGNLVYMMAGWVAYQYRREIPRISVNAALALFVAVLLAIWSYHANNLVTTNQFATKAWTLAIPAALCAVALVTLPSLDQHSDNRFLHFLGVTSFAVFAIHMPFKHTLDMPIPAKLAIVYLIAYGVYHFFERPLFALRRDHKAPPFQVQPIAEPGPVLRPTDTPGIQPQK